MPPLSGSWANALKGEFSKDYYKKLFQTVGAEYKTHTIYPPADDIFNAFHFTPLEQVKVVILGQDPYHEPGQAHGLCFSVKPEVDIPPSLVNIYKELEDDLGCYIPNNGYLEKWARQGVLMLNTVLTVRAHQGNRLGAVHGRGNQSARRAGPPDGLHPLGTSRTAQKRDDPQSKTSGADVRSSEPALCIPRIFRQPSVFQNERISGRKRSCAD